MNSSTLTVGLVLLGLSCATGASAQSGGRGPFGASAAAPAPTPAPAGGDKIDYVKDVKPIFEASCVKCHGLDPKKPKKKPAAGLRLDDKAAALKGGRSGAAIVPGDSKNSLLFKLLSGPVPRPSKDADDDKDIAPMPKAKRGEKWKPLPDAQIAVIRQWIDQGATWSE
jgi:mono/diheme cytochrome c family protein